MCRLLSIPLQPSSANGAGKSTVLRALDWFFNGKPGSLTEKDCSFGASEENIEVQVTFADLTEKDREALGKYAPEGVATFTAWKCRSPDGALKSFLPMQRLSGFQSIKAASSATTRRNFTRFSALVVLSLICLRQAWPGS